MADRSIIFSAPMVRSLLAGTKTQTRRVIKPAHPIEDFSSERLEDVELRGLAAVALPDGRHLVYRPQWETGDRLWVRETVRADELPDGRDGIRYLADEAWLPIPNSREAAERWVALNHYGFSAKRRRVGQTVSPIHMPRWASRLTLAVTDVRVERLNDISEADAQAEGVAFETADPPFYYVPGIHPHSLTAIGIEQRHARPAAHCFSKLWDHIHGCGFWQANPWVIATTFSAFRANIDAASELTTGGRA